ncbi:MULTISPECIES: ROK family protein [Chryseobacterium]|jgi:glucokinase|uniref:Glucokinase n=2 Tax=Chryseobacterium aquaticum TaxID=452084 RepID=A0A0Q3LUE6_9FLAO|nr:MULTISPECIES: ROK family protein [Chryseobacterium]KNB62098.1 glucokinase [Chryseobacterium sp. Hurlbut01]KQK26961.1 glucokinase [Chryseobacterium aquaticum]KUJ57542.1 glucokinase [Chryseobacterium aquaticum subsp. greenlandense]NMR33438.1 ROK family protein [Chryseobacterium aquaticum]NRQ45512.1 ROK family protein [Chryseobacterium sp. C-204]
MSVVDLSKQVALGIDIGGTNTKFGLVNHRGEILVKGSIPTDQYATPEAFIEALHQNILPLIEEYGVEKIIEGIGVGAPNANYYSGTIEQAPNLPWKGIIHFADLMTEKFGHPCKMTNDANAAALGEMMYGAARGMKDFIMITLGTGVGSGIVSGGHLIYGHDGFAGELGHTIVKPGGRKHWSTGSEGSLESYASATGIAITAKKMRAEFPESMLNQYPEDTINSKTVHECALKGDPVAIEVFRYTGQKLGEALANFVMFSSPEAILLFGGVIKAGDFILKPAKLHMERNLLPIFRNKVKLVFSELDEADAAILGASALVWEK